MHACHKMVLKLYFIPIKPYNNIKSLKTIAFSLRIHLSTFENFNLMIFIFDTCFLNLSTDAAQQNLFTTSARAQESLQTFLKIVNIPILFNKTLFS